MYDYGDYCPISKAAQILGERWTLLIVRELLSGSTRFNEIRRYLPKLSPTLLNARLRMLEEQGLVIRRKRPELRSFEYRLTPSGRELLPIVLSIGRWGARWAYAGLNDQEINTDVLMRDIRNSVDTSRLPAGRSVIQFQLVDQPTMNKWYLVADDGATEMCDEERSLDVDVYVTAARMTIAEIWTGKTAIPEALDDGRLKVTGLSSLVKTFTHWFPRSPFHGARDDLDAAHPKAGPAVPGG